MLQEGGDRLASSDELTAATSTMTNHGAKRRLEANMRRLQLLRYGLLSSIAIFTAVRLLFRWRSAGLWHYGWSCCGVCQLLVLLFGFGWNGQAYILPKRTCRWRF